MLYITSLPVELLLYIVDYAYDRDYIGSSSSFASANRYLSNSLLRKARRIKIDTSNEKWRSDEKRSKLFQMIDNPHHQLSVISKTDAFLDISDIVSQVDRIKGFSVSDSANLSSFLSSLNDCINKKEFILKELNIFDLQEVEYFAPIPCLETLYLRNGDSLNLRALNIPAFKLLRSLHLRSCSSVVDVSVLDGIHDLFLQYCDNIKDISCLNNNYRVHIKKCGNISTYSKSFRNSRKVTIVDGRDDFTISLENCRSLKTLSISGTVRSNVSLDISTMSISSLSFLKLYKVSLVHALPLNRLQRVSIIRCPHFKSLENMEGIRSVHLEGLNHITSLVGLGSGNQFVKLVAMKNLNDITSLIDPTVVELLDCPFILNLSILRVKILVISNRNHQRNCNDSVINLLQEIEKMQDLKAIKLSFPLTYDMIKSLVFSLPYIIKLVLLIRDSDEDERKLEEDKYIHERFAVTKIKQDSTLDIMLTRKLFV